MRWAAEESAHGHHGADHDADCTGYDYDGTARRSNCIITMIIGISGPRATDGAILQTLGTIALSVLPRCSKLC